MPANSKFNLHISYLGWVDSLLKKSLSVNKRRLWEYMGTLDKRFLPAMDKALAISIGLNGYSHCPMKQGRLSASLPAHECCPLHDDSVQKKD